MNSALQNDYTEQLLRRNWKGAAQILKVALEMDPEDATASEQFRDQQTRFLQEAGSLIKEARNYLANPNGNQLVEIASRFDSKYPEWEEFRDSNETLTEIWNATRIPANALPDTQINESDDVCTTPTETPGTKLRQLLQRADLNHLADLGRDQLLALKQELKDAEFSFALGVNTGTVSKSEISSAIDDISKHITSLQGRLMFRILAASFVIAVLLIAGIIVWLQVPMAIGVALSPELCNPKPESDDFILPMPFNGQMVFRPIVLRVNASVDKNLPFIEFTASGVGDQRLKVYGPFEAATERIYYLGKYEVTGGQFNAFISTAPPRARNLPMRNVTYDEAKEFCRSYTKWLHQQDKSNKFKLPRSKGGQIAQVLLPTSAEWEFAARGGSKTYGTSGFNQRFPYPIDDLNRYEWFAGSKSSYNEVHPVGGLRPNAVGCYDLIGNVREITLAGPASTTRWSGVPVARGGDYRTPENQIDVAIETPHPDIAPNGDPLRQEWCGFRVMLGTEEVDWQAKLARGQGGAP